MNIVDTFNNREIAIAIWLLILFAWALTKTSIRSALLQVVRALFAKKIIMPLLFMLAYTTLLVVFLERIGFWDPTAAKDTVYWFLGIAFVMFMNITKVSADDKYFRNSVIDNLKMMAVLEFVVNLYAFNLIAEFVVIPIVAFIAATSGYASVKPEYKQVKKVLDFLLGIFGIILIFFTLREITADFQNFITVKNLRDFLLPLVFTIAVLPFIYFLALFVEYESLFVRVDILNKNSDITRYAKWKIFTICHFSLRKLYKFSRNVGLIKVNNKTDVLAIEKKFRDN